MNCTKSAAFSITQIIISHHSPHKDAKRTFHSVKEISSQRLPPPPKQNAVKNNLPRSKIAWIILTHLLHILFYKMANFIIEELISRARNDWSKWHSHEQDCHLYAAQMFFFFSMQNLLQWIYHPISTFFCKCLWIFFL